MTDPRIYPLIDVSHEQLRALVGAPITIVERVEGGLTNTIHKVRLAGGETLAVKHYAGGVDSFGAELATLTLLHGTLPVPDVVHADEAAPVVTGGTPNDVGAVAGAPGRERDAEGVPRSSAATASC